MKKIKQWGKIRLWETSCCGIPMYPESHKSYSLIKALTETELEDEPSDKLNLEEKPMPEEKEEAKEAEEPKETPEPEKPEEPKVENPDIKSMTDILANAIKKAIQESEVKRGLSPEENVQKMEETLKKKSLGELAIMQGLFKESLAIGSPIGAR